MIENILSLSSSVKWNKLYSMDLLKIGLKLQNNV